MITVDFRQIGLYNNTKWKKLVLANGSSIRFIDTHWPDSEMRNMNLFGSFLVNVLSPFSLEIVAEGMDWHKVFRRNKINNPYLNIVEFYRNIGACKYVYTNFTYVNCDDV